MGTTLESATTLLLGLTVWVIYTFDHLNDARHIVHRASTERHRFHQKHFNILAFACILCLLLCGWLTQYIAPATLVYGTILGSIVLAYFMFLYWLKLKASYHKEISIALIYAAGIMLAPLSTSQVLNVALVLIIYIQFVLIALSNLLIFSSYEVIPDTKDASASLCRIIGVGNCQKLVWAMLIGQIVIAALVITTIPEWSMLEWVLLGMALVTGSLLVFRRVMIKGDTYRLVGDGVFILPIIAIL